MRHLADRLDLCSINTATLGYQLPIDQTIEAVASAGFGAIAPWRRELQGEPVKVVSRHIRDAGLEVSGYCRSSYIPAASEAEFIAAIDDNRRAIDDAAELGARCFVMVVGGLPEGSKDLPAARQQVHDGMSVLLEYARRQDVPLAIEPLHPMYAADRACINTLQQALDLCDALDPPQGNSVKAVVGVAVDLYHVWWDPHLQTQIMRAGRDKRLLGDTINEDVTLLLLPDGSARLEQLRGDRIDATVASGMFSIRGRDVTILFDEDRELERLHIPPGMTLRGGKGRLEGDVFQEGVNLEAISSDYRGITEADINLKVRLRIIS